ncbi:MAG: hypothetical protein A2538_00785 [Candidatus Magasanikbacteria bacterium RIFOXYD2_FULL_41_14]|uniref:Uncharacterized protein n=1 Tax=Candidatus Magasanikbacteria bacterium RIFOXYD2_FULL_41_14 TaxID=1798709 RepID=A0A1F6PDU9_9BACT|nr:MAG: hypothetical protein A2538_00785 [Candidatus Magasanikbacteria bacterium RIFOXYD2_FULL_41_14]
MLKIITLKLTNFKHSGDFIGDDVCVEINILDKFFSVDKKIKKNKIIACQDAVGQFFTDGKIFNPEITIAVIEKDLIYNDVGNISGKLKIDLEKTISQIVNYQVEVFEKRGKQATKNKKAIFEMTLEASVGPAISYVPETIDGWLVGKDSKGKGVSIPSFLKVRIDKRDTEHEYISILEGPLYGQKLSVKYRDDGLSYFVVNNPQTSAALATYSILKRVFSLAGKKYSCADYLKAPWEKGLYDIEMPDSPHPGGINYVNIAPHAKVWFRVGHSGARYIHTGRRSAGCITLTEQNRWEEVWNILVKARKGDGVSVGVLEVIE